MINAFGSGTGYTFWDIFTPEQSGKFKTPVAHTRVIKVKSPPPPGLEA